MCPRDKLRFIFTQQDFNRKMEGKERALNLHDMTWRCPWVFYNMRGMYGLAFDLDRHLSNLEMEQLIWSLLRKQMVYLGLEEQQLTRNMDVRV